MGLKVACLSLLLFAFIGTLAFGMKAAVEKKVLSSVSVYSSLVFQYSLCVLAYLLAVVLYAGVGVPSTSMMLLLVFSSIAGAASVIWYFQALSLEKASVVFAIACTYVLFAVALSVTFLGEPFFPVYALAIVVLVVSLLLLSGSIKIGGFANNPALVSALLSSVCLGVFSTVGKVVSVQLGAFNASLYMELGVLLVVSAYIVLSKKKLALPASQSTLGLMCLSSALLAIGVVAFNLSYIRIGLSLSSLIDSAAPAVTAVCAWLFLGERLSKKQYAGVLLMGVAIAVLSL
jgi:drug/metabolite transporter (DMT)-like permease